jgi:hypothetical protein
MEVDDPAILPGSERGIKRQAEIADSEDSNDTAGSSKRKETEPSVNSAFD